jgi:hypothetical protein
MMYALLERRSENGRVPGVAMSTHGRSGLISSLMGGVTERVLRRAPCPVFSIKPKAVEAAQS